MRPGAKMIIVCVDTNGQETCRQVPRDRRAFIPTIMMLRAAYGRAYACLEWDGDQRSRIGLSEEDAYGS